MKKLILWYRLSFAASTDHHHHLLHLLLVPPFHFLDCLVFLLLVGLVHNLLYPEEPGSIIEEWTVADLEGYQHWKCTRYKDEVRSPLHIFFKISWKLQLSYRLEKYLWRHRITDLAKKLEKAHSLLTCLIFSLCLLSISLMISPFLLASAWSMISLTPRKPLPS